MTNVSLKKSLIASFFFRHLGQRVTVITEKTRLKNGLEDKNIKCFIYFESNRNELLGAFVI